MSGRNAPRHSGAPRSGEPGIQKQTRNLHLDSGSPLRGVRNDAVVWVRALP
jgi:hypothetical protein